jgi:hypothetical protein
MGCEDGSLFIWHASRSPPIEPSPSPRSPHQRINSLHVNKSSARPSRSSSPHPSLRARSPSPSSSSTTPFNLASRSRIVSGVTMEQAQAPKNYVDFEEEPEKLKGMLKGSGVRERSVMDALPGFHHHELFLGGKKEKPSVSRTPTRPTGLSLPSSSKLRPRGNTDHSPAVSIRSLSPPPTPRSAIPTGSTLRLTCHILPHCIGAGMPVRDVQVTEDERYMFVLRQNGLVTVSRRCPCH